jgi:hypothetical protein
MKIATATLIVLSVARPAAADVSADANVTFIP